MQTLYGEISVTLVDKFTRVKLLVCDIDGVFSDGRIYLGNDGEELKAFHTKDGFGIKALIASGVQVAVITGRKSTIVYNRMRALNVNHIIQGQEDKLPALKEIAHQQNIALENIAYIGDDIPDLACIKVVGLGVAVNDAHPSVVQQADYITQLNGGFGAVRELCDTIMQCKNTLAQASGASI
ncbi:MAG: 3-deoxy-manno-octulosonate-8-phosphatase KdsC [Alteromonadaceae bacterium]|nr:3-deoxy-manno-octulosonate-8-phosphatase KdsC [Alteromonadaceae bacterium]MBL4910511.1 3-deoxy-manno-octulosonate-8-phosphatase KdsC [Alteromonadaceae bacterium]